MTMQELFRLVVRRWYVYVVGILTVVGVIFSLGNTPRIYLATVELEFNEPRLLPANLKETDQRETLISYAGAVVSRYSAEYPNVILSSPAATLFGNGHREGVAVRLASTGNQWAISFSRPVLAIDVASPRAEDVLSTISRVADEVESVSRNLQREAGAVDAAQITTSVDLDLVTVNSFGQTRTGRVGGAAVLTGAAMILSTLVGMLLDQLHKWRARQDEDSVLRTKEASKLPKPTH